MISRDCAKCSSYPKTFVVTFGLACQCSVQKDHCTCTSCVSEANGAFCATENTVNTATGVVHTTHHYYLLIMQYFPVSDVLWLSDVNVCKNLSVCKIVRTLSMVSLF